MFSLKFATAAATIAVVLAMQSASAGAPMHRMPAVNGPQQPVYQLKLNSAPKAGEPLVITLVNQSDGQTVRDGTVTVRRVIFAGIKSSPMIRYVPMALTRDANGSFECAGEHHVSGEQLTLRGTGPDGTSPVWLTVAVNS